MNVLSLSVGRRLVLLPPEQCLGIRTIGRVEANRSKYAMLLARMQRLRGEVYLADGAIDPGQLTSDGRHLQVADRESWHVLLMDGMNRVLGCARYRPHDPRIGFEWLGISSAEIARSDVWGPRLRRAVAEEIREARSRGVGFVEVGGWALAKQVRNSTEALRIALATYGLARALGGCIGLTTATVRHSSATILRKIGGRSLEAAGEPIPSYYDSQYGCEMEILRFDSAAPNPRFADWMLKLDHELSNAPVITCAEEPMTLVAAAAAANAFGTRMMLQAAAV
jgi:hypothetical protein